MKEHPRRRNRLERKPKPPPNRERQEQVEPMVEAPKVYCPKEKREVPIWWCLGSFTQRRALCPELLEATVRIAEDYAEVKCKAQMLTKKEAED